MKDCGQIREVDEISQIDFLICIGPLQCPCFEPNFELYSVFGLL